MLGYLVRRVLLAGGTILFISILSFIIIHLPPGDYVDAYIAQLSASGAIVSAEEAANLRAQYGLDQPMYIQYLRWIGLILRGNFCMAMEYKRPGMEIIGDPLPIPAVVLGIAATAQHIRIMRANLLDEKRKPYVVAARARGVPEIPVIVKYPVRVALNPVASQIPFILPQLVGGSIIVSVVLSLPTVGPVLCQALAALGIFLGG